MSAVKGPPAGQGSISFTRNPEITATPGIIIIIIIIMIIILLTYPSEKHDEGVEIEVTLAVALRIIVSPDDWEHAQTFREENHRPGGLVSPVLVVIIKLFLQQYPGIFLGQTLSMN